MLCKRCDTIFKKDGRTQRICRPCQESARKKSYRKRNEKYNKNTIRAIIKSQKLQNI
jgi:hypothetical protein